VTTTAAAEGNNPGVLQPVAETAAQARRETLRLILRSKTVWVGAVILVFWVICALFGTHIAPHDAYKQDLLKHNARPSGDHWLGTDALGRDVFSRVIVGSRNILLVAPLATLLGTLLGTALGLTMGYFRGLVDDILSRLVEAVLALPLVIVALTALAATGASNLTLVLVIGGVFAPIIARTVRAAVLTEREQEYVTAAELRGEKAPYILFAEVLPNVLPPILVEFTVRVGYAIFAVATLSFLGFGPQPPSPDWGLQIADQYADITLAWWAVVFPAIAIASLVVGINLMADTIQQVLDE
jgi:peptide/nickel transport system permease protein